MTDEHEHEHELELLAGYALLALEGEDAREADRLLSEHVPTCVTCRGGLTDLRALTGELALATAPIEPPDLVLARVRRGIRDVPARRRRGAGIAALATSVAALVGMASLSLSLGGRATRAEAERGTALEVLSAMRHPGADPVALEAAAGTEAGELVEVSGPGLEHMYVYGDGVPAPSPGNGYQVWLGSDGAFTRVGETFEPEGGLVLISLTVDPSRYDEVLITEEALGAPPSEPSLQGGHTWRASI